MATYVLVHGGGHGGLGLTTKRRRRAASAGPRGHAPTLTGLGERSHLLSADIDLDMHIQDIRACSCWTRTSAT